MPDDEITKLKAALRACLDEMLAEYDGRVTGTKWERELIDALNLVGTDEEKERAGIRPNCFGVYMSCIPGRKSPCGLKKTCREESIRRRKAMNKILGLPEDTI